MLFLFVCLFVFSKISFLHGAVFILYWELAFFGLNVFFYSVILYISHKNTKTNIHTHTHTHPHIHMHTYTLHCGSLIVCVTAIVMFVVLLL